MGSTKFLGLVFLAPKITLKLKSILYLSSISLTIILWNVYFSKVNCCSEKGGKLGEKSSFFKLIRKVAADFLQICEFTFICKHSGASKLVEKVFVERGSKRPNFDEEVLGSNPVSKDSFHLSFLVYLSLLLWLSR